mgnify:CR=1 FL=1
MKKFFEAKVRGENKQKSKQQHFDKQTRIEMALRFLNLLFGAVSERLFGYLWTKQDKATYPFAVSNSDERIAMAKKAIELSDEGKDVYFGVNLMNDPPARNAHLSKPILQFI